MLRCCDAVAMAVSWVLIHSPLVGPATWNAMSTSLADSGIECRVPDLRPALLAGPPYWSRQVEVIASSAAGGGPAVLVGHSGAGPLLAAAGQAVGPVAGYVFIDAGLPTAGRSWTQSAPGELVEQLRSMRVDGWLPPWSQWWGEEGLTRLLPDPETRDAFASDCRPLPWAMFEERHPTVPSWPDAPCGYVRLSTAYQGAADQARARGWPTIELDAYHLAMLADPETVLVPLLELARRLVDEP